MKIAVISDDGVSVSQHFGRAAYYYVFSIENGNIATREQRPKLGHSHFSGQTDQANQNQPHSHHGDDPAAQSRHIQMAETISDCEALIAGGMGRGAYNSLLGVKIKPIITDIESIEEAVQAFIQGTIIDHPENLH
jgi:predicted Fe-Mo cluster-binding NifX family protein